MNSSNFSIRRWPYPFQAAVSISNDIDFCQFDFFEMLMGFLNTRRATAFGTGLGLEVTSSFFFFSPPTRQFSYYVGLDVGAPRSAQADRLDEYLAAGWLDSNHAYGDFDGVGGFRREHAIDAWDRCKAKAHDVRVYINHGDDKNTQCIGEGGPHHRGDRLGSIEYHADLVFSDKPSFLTTSVHSVGHVDEAPHSTTQMIRGIWPGRETPSYRQFRDWSRASSELLNICRLQDERFVNSFWRLRGTGVNAPNLGSLDYQVRLLDVGRLIREQGVAILYQHWGVLHRIGRECHPASVADVLRYPHLLSGFRRLARHHEIGEVWIPGLQRLLDYEWMRQRVVLSLESSDSDVVDVDMPGVDFKPAEIMQGLTVYVNPLKRTQLRCRGVILPVDFNGPDETGRYSLTVQIQHKADIW